MKKFILIFAMVLGMTAVFAQGTATLSLVMPTPPTTVGEQFTVEFWLDELTYSPATMKSAQIFLEFDEANVIPVSTGPPFFRYWYNLNQMFVDYSAQPSNAYPFPGDLRYVFFTTVAPGLDPQWYGGVPMKFWEIEFMYMGNGDVTIDFGLTAKLESAGPFTAGGTMTKGETKVTSWDNEEYILTLNGLGPMGGANVWTGAIDDDWFNGGNWSLGTVPVAEDVEIPVTAKANPVILGGSATTGMLTVMPGAGLAVDATGDLTTGGLFTCDGDFYIYTENASGYSGSFIPMAGLAGTGMFYFTREMLCTGSDPAWDENPFGWHYLGAVIDGLSTDDLVDYYANQWDEVGDTWMNYAGVWTCIPYAPAEILDGMEAWSINYDSEWPYAGAPGGPCPGGTGLDIEFAGPFVTMHDGPYAAGATVSGGMYSGWNMFTNPYPSGLDMNAIAWDVPNVIPGAAYWDGCAGLANSYVTWSPALGAYSMAPGLGFFTEWTAPGTFAVANADRAHGADWFWKEEITSLLTLQLNMGDEAGDVTHVRFMEEAQAGFAPDGDFHKMMDASAPNLYTTVGEDKLAINALPSTESVPMGFTAAQSGEYSIEAIETSEFNEVYLQDLETGAVTDMINESYTFNYTTGSDADRFIIHFGPLGTPEFDANSVKIWSNENLIMVQAPSINGEIVVVNMMGQEMVRQDIDPGTNVIPMNEVNTYYVVKVISSENAVTGKVYIK